jgi:hypothetical protein
VATCAHLAPPEASLAAFWAALGPDGARLREALARNDGPGVMTVAARVLGQPALAKRAALALLRPAEGEGSMALARCLHANCPAAFATQARDATAAMLHALELIADPELQAAARAYVEQRTALARRILQEYGAPRRRSPTPHPAKSRRGQEAASKKASRTPSSRSATAARRPRTRR